MVRRLIGLSYYRIIREAIASYPHRRATARMIFGYLGRVYAAVFRGISPSRWQACIRQRLSRKRGFFRARTKGGRATHYWTFCDDE